MQLALIFAERLQLALLPRCELDTFRADGVRYRATGSGQLTFLYDRLLDADGTLAGLLLWCFSHDGIDAALGGPAGRFRPYLVRRSYSPTIALYEVRFRELTAPQSEAVASDGAQQFGGQVFRSADGGLAVHIDVSEPLGAELSVGQDPAAVFAPAAHWPVITDAIEYRAGEA